MFFKDIDEVEKRIEFMEDRINDSTNKQWRGIFRRPLLW